MRYPRNVLIAGLGRDTRESVPKYRYRHTYVGSLKYWYRNTFVWCNGIFWTYFCKKNEKNFYVCTTSRKAWHIEARARRRSWRIFFGKNIALYFSIFLFSLSLLLSLSFVEVLYVCLSYFCISFSLFSFFLTIFNQCVRAPQGKIVCNMGCAFELTFCFRGQRTINRRSS